MGAKKIVMGEFALFLMHRCSNWVDTWGQMNSEEIADAIKKLEASKNALETIDQTVANIYAARCGKKVKDVAEWMKDAVWLNADDCKQRGLVDEICKDEEHPVITNALKGEILACGFPVPENRQEKDADLSLRSFLEGIRSLFASRSATNTQTTKDMNTENKDFKNVLAALKADSITTSDGKAVLSDEQMNALDTRLSTLSALEKENAELKARVSALEKNDGEETNHIEATATEDPAADYASRARSAYAKLKAIG